MKTAIQLVEKGLIPRPLIRRGIRKLLGERLAEQEALWHPDPQKTMRSWVAGMRAAPIALVPELANEQHYELPPAFFEIVLGVNRKYSSAYYDSASTTLDQAEEAMLSLTCERARLQDGQSILELGCGWGSLTLFMARAYPNSRVTAVSNSAPQRQSIMNRARTAGLENVEVITADMNQFAASDTYDRVVSVEMFEHMRNWEALLARADNWLEPGGRMFMHVFAHKKYAYPFEVRDDSDWMSRFFFSGGMMPSHDLLDHLNIPLEVEERWKVNGTHYARTSEDWARNLDSHRAALLPILAETYGARDTKKWFHRWRVFFLSCAELFAWNGGNEWIVSHQLLRKKADGNA